MPSVRARTTCLRSKPRLAQIRFRRWSSRSAAWEKPRLRKSKPGKECMSDESRDRATNRTRYSIQISWKESGLQLVGRKQFGRISIANSDAGARAFTDTAIDQAYRAVREQTRRS